MIRIVTISPETHRPGINEVGDIVAVHNNNVKLGPAYASFNVIEIEGITVEEFKASQTAKIPEKKRQWKNESGEWNDLVKEPKYYSTISLTPSQRVVLASGEISKDDKEAILSVVINDTIKRDPENMVK